MSFWTNVSSVGSAVDSTQRCTFFHYLNTNFTNVASVGNMQLIVHERYRFFHYLNTNFTNVVSVGSAVDSTQRCTFFHYLNTNFTNVASVGSAVNST